MLCAYYSRDWYASSLQNWRLTKSKETSSGLCIPKPFQNFPIQSALSWRTTSSLFIVSHKYNCTMYTLYKKLFNLKPVIEWSEIMQQMYICLNWTNIYKFTPAQCSGKQEHWSALQDNYLQRKRSNGFIQLKLCALESHSNPFKLLLLRDVSPAMWSRGI